MTNPGKLYIVPTPIGNLEDMTLRAIRILKEAELILAEDTRTSLRLLEHYGIKNSLKSHHKFNEHGTVREIAAKIEAGISVALISDAGTPGISDPGFLLVRTCLDNGIEVDCLPGATAFVPALVNSGFPCDRFIFEGFLPQKKGRQKRLSALADEKRTIILYESPFRLVRLLEEMAGAFGNERRCSVSRELTKIYEENVRGTIAEVLTHFREKQPKGEIVVVVEGKGKNDFRERSDLSEGENEETEGLSDRVSGRLRD
jgi:16S rRNA (cytidine1402-2'-O)-methyltransferase